MLPRGKTLPDIQLIIVQDVSDVECKFLFKNFIFNRSVAFIIFRVGHPSPLSHSRIFVLPYSHPLSTCQPSSPPTPASGNHEFTFCVCGFAQAGHFT